MVGLIISFILTLLVFAWHFGRRKHHPPGPIGLPVFGMLPIKIIHVLLYKYCKPEPIRVQFKRMQEKYGDIWSMEFANQRIVTLASFEAIYEAFVQNAEIFSGRPLAKVYKIFCNDRGILFVDGEKWKENRRHTVKSLKDLGMGKKSLEKEISEEADEFISYLEKHYTGKSTDLSLELMKPVSNIICRLVFNDRNEYDNAAFVEYAKAIRYLAEASIFEHVISISPDLFKTKFARWFLPEVDQFFNQGDESLKYIEYKCAERRKVLENVREPQCIFDYFWLYRYGENSQISMHEKILEINWAMYDLFAAGADSTSNMLSFCLLFLGKYSNIQEELRSEIHSLTMDHRSINMDMRKNCPKLLSFIDEIHRYCTVAEKFHHRVMQKCVFRGYELYPNDIIFGDINSIFKNEKCFENPNIFDAHRFLDGNHEKYVPNKLIIPFSIGKRACLGEGIANVELFTILTKILFRFQIDLPSDTKESFDLIVDGDSSIVHSPLYHKIVLNKV